MFSDSSWLQVRFGSFQSWQCKMVANRITRCSCSSKGVNNQMEVNDRKKHSGGDGKNMTKTRKLMIMHSQWLFSEDGFIF